MNVPIAYSVCTHPRCRLADIVVNCIKRGSTDLCTHILSPNCCPRHLSQSRTCPDGRGCPRGPSESERSPCYEPGVELPNSCTHAITHTLLQIDLHAPGNILRRQSNMLNLSEEHAGLSAGRLDVWCMMMSVKVIPMLNRHIGTYPRELLGVIALVVLQHAPRFSF